MATVTILENAGILHKIDPALEDGEQEFRLVHASSKLRDWLENELPDATSQWNIETSPLEQFVVLIEEFGGGLPLVFDRQFKAFHRKPLEPAGDGVWYLKTGDLRIFGWFWKRDFSLGWLQTPPNASRNTSSMRGTAVK